LETTVQKPPARGQQFFGNCRLIAAVLTGGSCSAGLLKARFQGTNGAKAQSCVSGLLGGRAASCSGGCGTPCPLQKSLTGASELPKNHRVLGGNLTSKRRRARDLFPEAVVVRFRVAEKREA